VSPVGTHFYCCGFFHFLALPAGRGHLARMRKRPRVFLFEKPVPVWFFLGIRYS
jgi:hypothetical protein